MDQTLSLLPSCPSCSSMLKVFVPQRDHPQGTGKRQGVCAFDWPGTGGCYSFPHLATTRVMSSCCSLGLNCWTSSTMAASNSCDASFP
jgi:hypothetical protein